MVALIEDWADVPQRGARKAMSQVLVIVPDDGVREELRRALGPGSSLRARTYDHGLLLAEQHVPSRIVLWSPAGADGPAIQTLQKLRRLVPQARIVVITPTINSLGLAVMDHLRPKAFLPQRSISAIVAAVTGIGTPPVNSPPPTWSGGGSSAMPE
jgi:DNA-binding NarL/FixJ family response regulator